MFVSVGAVRRERHHETGYIPSSSLPPPNWDSTPMIILLQEKYFEQLFAFLEALDHFVDKRSSSAEKTSESSCNASEVLEKSTVLEQANQLESNDNSTLLPLMESQIEFLFGIAWELLFLLPTNQSVLNQLRYFGQSFGSETGKGSGFTKAEMDQRNEDNDKWQQKVWQSLLNPKFPHKLLYSLQVIDLIHNSSKETQTPSSPTYSGLSSDSDISDTEEEKNVGLPQSQGFSWGYRFMEYGGLRHLYEILMSGCLEVKENSIWTQWHQECLAHLLKLICEFGTMKRSGDDDDEVFMSSESDAKKLQLQRKDGKFRVRYKSTDKEEVICIKCLSSNLMSIVHVNSLLEKLLHISYEATLPIRGGQNRASGGEGESHFFHASIIIILQLNTEYIMVHKINIVFGLLQQYWIA